MNMPNGWMIDSLVDAESTTEIAVTFLEESLVEKIEISGLNHLLGYSKNPFNRFQSTSEPFNENIDCNWSEHNKLIKNIIIDAF
ncbi:MAG: hypothetical protein HRU38_12325 [Saccharospirillaceae bacterium]|nr:hypothetical protein [Pseudomonadales bacterium]NRB79434.1 hypothetical protein [Saccharospirillaceae bacterium]